MKKLLLWMMTSVVFLLQMTSVDAATFVMHTVEKGDTYYSLSKEYNTNVDHLLLLNHKNTASLYQGDLMIVSMLPKNISLTVDGKPLYPDAMPYMENQRTFVPIRFISEAIGANVVWNDANKQAVITMDSHKIVLPAGKSYAYVDQQKYALDAPIQLHQDRTFIPLRFIAEILGCDVAWDGAKFAIHLTTTQTAFANLQPYSAEDLYWLSRIVEAEAGGESYAGKLAVANVVINRKEHHEFPNTIKSVVFDRQNGTQFTPVKNGTIYNSPSQGSVNAATEALKGHNNVEDCLYFINPRIATKSWVSNNRTFYAAIGQHNFHL